MGMMKRINEQRLFTTIPAALRRWLRENPESRHLVDPAPLIKGEGGSSSRRVPAKHKLVQMVMFQ